jgi:preprotein translocase SecE subunit
MSTEKKTNWLTAAPTFVSESVAELKKVHSPTTAETVQATIVTLIIMSVVSILLFLLDLAFGSVLRSLL